MKRESVIVADAQPIFRFAVRSVLGQESRFEVLEAADLDELAYAVVDDTPAIVLVDLDLPPRGGLEAVELVAERSSACSIVWGFDPSPETVLGAIRRGAIGCLDKEITGEGLVRAFHGALRGEAPLSRPLASRMIKAIHGEEQQARARVRASLLSSRELEVLELVAVGARNKDVASALTISELTVKRHMQNILAKLELTSRRSAAAVYASAFDVSMTSSSTA